MSKLLVRFRHLFLSLTLLFALVGAVLMFHVNVNTDLTRYLPSDSPMRAGLELMQSEMGVGSQMAGPSVRVMTQGRSPEESVEMRHRLLSLPEVEQVAVQTSGSRTLYELSVPADVDQVALGRSLGRQFSHVEAVETSQDGTTAETPMLLGAMALLLVVLFAVCASWLEPVLFLASTGVAVLLNTGTNALLPSVSVTTHSIAPILQLVLSMDYSIILINRYRQQRPAASSSPEAMQQAVRLAAPSILSSALTTIVGLIMLVFMRLRIGADLGIVLSKGVFFSLVCTFTLLPSLILLCERGIERSRKPALRVPTASLARFSMRYRVPLLLFFVLLLGGSYLLHRRTPFSFLNAPESAISTHFPKKNPVVLLYSNADEPRVIPLLDSLQNRPEVEVALSYPSIMLRPYTAPAMLQALQGLSSMAADTSLPALPLDMLSADVLQMLYFAANGLPVTRLSFPELADFLLAQSKDPASVVAAMMDPEMRQQLALLDDLRRPSPLVEPDTLPLQPQTDTLSLPLSSVPQPSVALEQPQPTFVEPVAAVAVSPFTDTVRLLQPMTSDQLAAYLGMDPGQARMVYRLAKSRDGLLTPHRFVHFVTDELLSRRALAAMVGADQRLQLLALRATMDSALLRPSALPEVRQTVPTVVPTVEAEPEAESTALLVEADTLALQPQADTLPDPLALLSAMLSGTERYTPRAMARNLSAMGQPLPESLVQMLYLYYGGVRRYQPQWTMTLARLVDFLADTLVADPRFATLVTPQWRESLRQGRQLLSQQLAMLRGPQHSVAVLVTSLPAESDSTYRFVEQLHQLCGARLTQPYHAVGESVMLHEMRSGFRSETTLVTLLTIAAIFLIVAFTFRSLLLALLLVGTVMTGVFVDVAVSALHGPMLYMAYLVVQSILMGAAIDYGILFASCYRESRRAVGVAEALARSYRSSIHTILTSGLILILVPGAMGVLVADPTVASIVRAISVGALTTVLLVLLVLPGMLATCDRFIAPRK